MYSRKNTLQKNTYFNTCDFFIEGIKNNVLNNTFIHSKVQYNTFCHTGTVNNKINGTTKDVYLPISKIHSILAVANLLAYNNLWLCYYVQVNLL